MSAPQPGWYPDPTNAMFLRFYDGQQWTNLNFSIPADGQITPEMVAASQQYMAQLSSQPFNAPVHPGAVQTDRHEADEKPKTSGLIWAIMGISVVGIAGIGIWGAGLEPVSIEKPAGAFSADYKLLDVADDFDCAGLVDGALEISASNDTADEILVQITDTRMTQDRRDSFELPSDEYAEPEIAFVCEGSATYADGTSQQIMFDFSADYYQDLYVYYDPK